MPARLGLRNEQRLEHDVPEDPLRARRRREGALDQGGVRGRGPQPPPKSLIFKCLAVPTGPFPRPRLRTR